MNIFSNKDFIRKIGIILVVIILFNFVAPKISFAGDTSTKVFGILFDPIKDLVLGISDSTMKIVQKIVLGQDVSVIKLEHKDAKVENAIKIAIVGLGAALGTTLAIMAIPATGGMSLAAVASAVVGVVKATVTTTIVSGVAVSFIPDGWFGDDIYLPLINVSPEEIFSNKIPLLDVNFFKAPEDRKNEEGEQEYEQDSETRRMGKKGYYSYRRRNRIKK